jgi:hypothetical protein
MTDLRDATETTLPDLTGVTLADLARAGVPPTLAELLLSRPDAVSPFTSAIAPKEA